MQLFDLYPTLVEAARGKLSAGHFAKSLVPVAAGAKRAVRESAFREISTR